MSTEHLPHRAQSEKQTQELRWLALFSAVCCGLALITDAVVLPAIFAALAVFSQTASRKMSL
jgi:hypothetical protein